MITINQFRDRETGEPVLGFSVRNGAGKLLALGAWGKFVQMSHGRYAHDRPLVEKIAKLTGLVPRS